jgi:Calcineurin-like phosphoesterase
MDKGEERGTLRDGEFARLYEELGPTNMKRRAGLNHKSNITRQLRRVERKMGRRLNPPGKCGSHAQRISNIFPERVEYELKNGIALIISDLHIWPGPRPLMQRAFIKFCKDLEPSLVILNGDVVDMAAVSQHPPINWERLPTVQEEIEAGQDYLHQIAMACRRGTPKVWTLGNHDERFEKRLAVVAPEYAKLKGVHLKDHFPDWEPARSCWINDDVVIKHNFKNGIHAPHNNTMWSGKTTITSHLHSAKVLPFTDYNGTRYGVDTGTGADIYGPQFLYAEDNPRNWRSSFCGLTFVDGKLLQPELVLAWDDKRVQFRGELIAV